ncbi:hypothetical protein U9M48_001294 [Paspalum notatum var. saurae]|uniref:Uncharacterized protein n=1 Tax=Paspalum notatum var. saurae TaxID=547442 RepID=A0AAQ3PLQ8_PASNO
MADPIGIVQSIIGLLVTINELVGTFHNNEVDCDRICTLVARAQAVVGPLKQTPKVMENKGMSAALKGLEEALQHSMEVVKPCKKKNAIRRGIQSKDITGDLRRAYEHISANMVLVVLANVINNNSMLVDIMESLADLRARDAYDSMLTKILEIVAAHPDVHLQQEVKTLVHTYHNSTEYAARRSEVKNEKDNVPVADIKAPCASLSDGSAKSTPVKKVIGQGGTSTVSKDSSHSSNPTDGAGSSKEKKIKRNKIDGPIRPEIKTEKTNVTADSKGPHPRASSPDGTAKSTSMNGQSGLSIVNKISRSTGNMTQVTSMDMHPSKPWIMTGHKGGLVSIWDYTEQQTVMERQVTKVPGNFANFKHKCSQFVKEKAAPHWVCSVKFIAEEKWLAVGDGDGYIHLYTFKGTKLHKVDKFRANPVDSLAVHPTKKYFLSSSAYGKKINLWDWSNGWVQIHEFDIESMYPDGVLSLKFNPRDTKTFACVTDDQRLQVGNIESFSLTTKLKGQLFKAADYFFTCSRQNLMVTLRSTSPHAEILDLKTGEVVGTLGVSGHETRRVAGHPALPILVTALDDGTVCFWDANTYRLGKKVRIADSPACHLALFTDINDIASPLAGHVQSEQEKLANHFAATLVSLVVLVDPVTSLRTR